MVASYQLYLISFPMVKETRENLRRAQVDRQNGVRHMALSIESGPVLPLKCKSQARNLMWTWCLQAPKSPHSLRSSASCVQGFQPPLESAQFQSRLALRTDFGTLCWSSQLGQLDPSSSRLCGNLSPEQIHILCPSDSAEN